MASIADEIEYKLDAVKASSLNPDEIDPTFRSTCIGEPLHLYPTLDVVHIPSH